MGISLDVGLIVFNIHIVHIACIDDGGVVPSGYMANFAWAEIVCQGNGIGIAEHDVSTLSCPTYVKIKEIPAVVNASIQTISNCHKDYICDDINKFNKFMSEEQQFLAASALLVKQIKEMALEFNVADKLVLIAMVGIVNKNENGDESVDSVYDVFVHDPDHFEEGLNFLEQAYIQDNTPEKGTVEWWLRRM